VQVGIIRPGPIVGKMVHPYLKRRQCREAPDSLHPSLEPVLARTLGVPLFQETTAPHGYDRRRIFRGRGPKSCAGAFGFKRSEARMKDIEKKTTLWDGEKRNRRNYNRIKSFNPLLRSPYMASLNRMQPALPLRPMPRLFFLKLPLFWRPSLPPMLNNSPWDFTVPRTW